ncbi:MAG: YfiH family protein [Porticoccus sp.]|jgi:YfiH family protein
MNILKPDWPAPVNVFSVITTRRGGVSLPPWDSLNLGLNTGDSLDSIKRNWRGLSKELNLPSVPQLLDQVHGSHVIKAICGAPAVVGDASFTDIAGTVCAVTTADCLPILMCNTQGTIVSSIHAGWRGLSAGIVKNTIRQLAVSPRDLMVYLGPAISQKNFEVGVEVRRAFLSGASNPCMKEKLNTCFLRTVEKDENKTKKWMTNLYGLARVILNEAGVTQIYGGDLCTYSDHLNFYSYRRDGSTGRMASLIWFV